MTSPASTDTIRCSPPDYAKELSDYIQRASKKLTEKLRGDPKKAEDFQARLDTLVQQCHDHPDTIHDEASKEKLEKEADRVIADATATVETKNTEDDPTPPGKPKKNPATPPTPPQTPNPHAKPSDDDDENGEQDDDDGGGGNGGN